MNVLGALLPLRCPVASGGEADFSLSMNDDVYLDKEQSRGVKKSILYM
jgi:hypothetical protein